MIAVSNNLGRLAPWVQWIAGTLTQSGTGSTLTMSYQSGVPPADQGSVSFTKTSTGVYTLTVQQFLANNGAIVSSGLCTMSTGLGYSASYAYSYSGETATITISVFNTLSQAAADCAVSFNFEAI